MSSKFSRYFLLVTMAVVSFLAYSITAFAEGDVVCSGKVMGTTQSSNPNAGQIHFNSHPGPDPIPVEAAGQYNINTDLSIVGRGEGLAPGDRKYAACVSEDTSPAVPLAEDEYVMKGYGWNDNLGFISFYCNAGQNEGVACGLQNYGVKIGVADAGGDRELSGYAWNDAFGYIQFKGQGTSGGVPFDYGVVADSNGNLSGWAWSEAGIWIKFDGAKIQLPGEEIVYEEGEWCDDLPKPFLCVEVDADPDELGLVVDAGGSIVAGLNGAPKVADGVEEYQINLYLKEADGVTPLDIGDVDDFEFTFNWTDTVKRNQLAGETKDLASESEPWDQGGAILFKPVVVNKGNFSDIFEEVEGLGAKKEIGHYRLKAGKTIKSFAPTTNANVSYTTSTQPPIPFKNELFLEKLGTNDDVWTDDIEPNELILNSIDFDITIGGDSDSAVIYPNGKDGLSFKYRPAIEVDPLYANDVQDVIIGFRGIPVNFRVGTTENGHLEYDSGSVKLVLDYAKMATQEQEGCLALPEDLVNFAFNFLGNGGNELEVGLSIDPFDVPAVATLPACEPPPGEEEWQNPCDPEDGGQRPCDMAQGPTLYSIISYAVDGEKVSFYGNKLPRGISMLINPAAVIHGTISAQQVTGVSAKEKVQATGSIMVDKVRDAVHANVEKYLGDLLSGGGSCTITALRGLSDIDMTCTALEKLTVGEENVLHFKDTDVELEIGNGDNWEGRWALVIEDGNLYINEDIYHADMAHGKMAIVLLRTYGGDCATGSNVYIHSDVKNIQANIAADCSIFSYHPLNGPVDPGTGLPDWGDFPNMIASLNKQLYLQGSASSRNTIGGADKDTDPVDPKNYLLLGTGETVGVEDKLLAQLYDINYWRLFRLNIALAENGLPIDQKCGKALTIEDMMSINAWKAGGMVDDLLRVLGENGEVCDGINPLEIYDPAAGNFDGDLVAIAEEEALAQGLGHDGGFNPANSSPVRVDYVRPDSFLFN